MARTSAVTSMRLEPCKPVGQAGLVQPAQDAVLQRSAQPGGAPDYRGPTDTGDSP